MLSSAFAYLNRTILHCFASSRRRLLSVRETCRENKDMVCGGRAKKPARAQREDYAEQRELKSLSSHGAAFFS